MTTTVETLPAIAAAVIVHEGKVLLIRRREREGKLLWQFPAGAVEEGESREDASVRETREETGVEVAAREALGERVHPQTGRLMSYTACEPIGDCNARVGDPEEIDAVEWVESSRLADYVPYGFFEPVQAYLDEMLNR